MTNKRKTLIIDREFQYHHILQVVLLTFICINAVVITAFVFLGHAIGAAANLLLAVSIVTVEIVALVVIFWITRRSSNRIAGPVYHIARTLEEAADGDLTARIRLREKDHFQTHAEAVNRALQRIHDRVAGLQELANRIDAEPGPALIAELNKDLAWFTTGPSLETSEPESSERMQNRLRPGEQAPSTGYTLVELMLVVLVISILAMIAIPSYQIYSIRAKVAEGFTIADPVKRSLTEHYLERGEFPGSNAAAGLPEPNAYQTTHVERIEVLGSEDGRFQVVYDISGLNPRNVLILVPFPDAEGAFSWNCNDQSDPNAVPPRYLPVMCRH